MLWSSKNRSPTSNSCPLRCLQGLKFSSPSILATHKMIQDFRKSSGRKEKSTRISLMIRWGKRHLKIIRGLIRGLLQECQLRGLIKVLLLNLTKVHHHNLIRAHHQDLIRVHLQDSIRVLLQDLTKVHPLVTIKVLLLASLSHLQFLTKEYHLRGLLPNLTKGHQEWIPMVELLQTNLTSDVRKSKITSVI